MRGENDETIAIIRLVERPFDEPSARQICPTYITIFAYLPFILNYQFFERKLMTLKKYYVGLVTANPNNNHEVHKETCRELPSPRNREYLGAYSRSEDALKEAKRYFKDADGCRICCPEIHRA